MYLRLYFFAFLIGFLLTVRTAVAQERWFEATGGLAFSQPEATGAPWHYKGRVLPHLGISGFFSFNKTFALKTGLLYQQKGLSTKASYKPDSVYQFEQFSSVNTYHFISVPLQLAVNFARNGIGVYRFAAGMSYGFLAAANSEIEINSYYDEQRRENTSVKYNQLVSAQPKNDIKGLPAHEGTPVYFFVPAVRLDVSYEWQERFIFSLFYEYNLQDIRMRTVDNSKMNLHYAGIAAGIRFW